jgi:hypothetical protein
LVLGLLSSLAGFIILPFVHLSPTCTNNHKPNDPKSSKSHVLGVETGKRARICGARNCRPESLKHVGLSETICCRRYEHPALHLPHFARPYFAYAIQTHRRTHCSNMAWRNMKLSQQSQTFRYDQYCRSSRWCRDKRTDPSPDQPTYRWTHWWYHRIHNISPERVTDEIADHPSHVSADNGSKCWPNKWSDGVSINLPNSFTDQSFNRWSHCWPFLFPNGSFDRTERWSDRFSCKFPNPFTDQSPYRWSY